MKSPFHPLLVVTTLLLTVPAWCQEQEQERPRKLESLTTTKGRTYEKVQIREVTPAGIKIAHESGTATISFQELPAALQKQLGGFDHKAAEAHLKEVQAKVRSQEAEIERGLREQQKAANPVKPAPAPAPAAPADPAPAPSGGDNPWDIPLPTDVAPKEASLPDPTPEEAPVDPTIVPKGVVSARIVGYRSGVKRVEFRARANCKGKLQVFRVAPDLHSRFGHVHTYDIEPNKEFAEEIWVFNNYNAELTSSNGNLLDSESHDKKTSLGGGLGGASLR